MMSNFFVYGTALLACFGNILCGLSIGSFNGVLEMEPFHLSFPQLYNNSTSNCSSGNGANSDAIIGLMVSGYSLGAAFSSLMAGWLADKISRKYGLFVTGLLTILGSASLTFSFQIWLLILGRILSGFAYGLLYSIMPTYIAEISPKELRGRIGSFIGPSFALGFLLAAASNIGFTRFWLGWRVSFGIQGVFGIVYVLGVNYLAHTPRWLVLKRRDKEAYMVLHKINGSSDGVDCVLELEKLREARTESENAGNLLKELLKWSITKRIIIALTLVIFPGYLANIIFYYNATIFCKINIDPFIGSAIVGTVTLLSSVVPFLLMDKIGRKLILLLGFSFLGAAALTGGVLIQLFNLDVDFNPVVSYIMIAIVCFMGFTYSSSILVVNWIIISEIFPLHLRGLSAGLISSMYWLSTYISNQIAPLIFGSSIKTHGYFYMCMCLCFLYFTFSLIFIPETKGVSLEDMESIFSMDWRKHFLFMFRCRLSRKSKTTLSSTNPFSQFPSSQSDKN